MSIVTWNPSDKNSNIILSNSNITATSSSTGWAGIRSIITSSTSQNLYWEIKIDIIASNGIFIGIGNQLQSLNSFLGDSSYGIGIYSYDGKYYANSTWSGYSKSLTTNDIIGIALDLNTKKIKFSINGVWYPDINISYITGAIYPMISLRSNGKITANFGNDNFVYPIPSGYTSYDVSHRKYLIKQSSNYYTINSSNYDSNNTHNFIPVTLNGGVTPNKNDIETFGFDDINIITNDMTIGNDTFKPIDKLGNQFDIKLYKLI